MRENNLGLVSVGWALIVTIIDSGCNPATLRYDLVAATQAAAAAATATILTALAAVTESVVSGYALAERFTEDAFVFPTTAQNENRAVVSCLLDGFATKKVTIVIPAPAQGLFVTPTGPGSNIVDITDSALITYVDIWRLTGALASISDGEFIGDSGSIIRGKRTHRQ